MTDLGLLQVDALDLDAPGGRPLLRQLSLRLQRAERAALVGRNGVGKSSLLSVLSGLQPPAGGRVRCTGSRLLVPQLLAATAPEPPGCSPGEQREQRLRQAFDAAPDLLLLDEPTHDLDRRGIQWLLDQVRGYPRALLVVSHDRRLLSAFDDFLVVSETGCRHLNGNLEELLRTLEHDAQAQTRRYVQQLNRLEDAERRNEQVRRRRQRKKNLGRLHELRRCPSRAKLNENRGYAQQSQGLRAVLQQERMQAARDWARAARRALRVELPLSAVLPTLPPADGRPVVRLSDVAASAGGRVLFRGVSLRLARERVVLTGDNGTGKTTLLEITVGSRQPASGKVTRQASHVGYIAQNAANFQLDDSLIERLAAAGLELEQAAQTLQAHRFPLALAERPLRSLSPGERVRAALICLFQQPQPPQLLVLDEPTEHLDFVGATALFQVLQAFAGGLLLVSHDEPFVQELAWDRRLRLQGGRLVG